MKRFLGVLVLLIGAPLVIVGILITCAVWAALLEHHDLWWLYILSALIGLVPAGFGAFLLLVAWVMFRGSRAGSAEKQ